MEQLTNQQTNHTSYSNSTNFKDVSLRNSNFTQFELNLILSFSTTTCFIGTLSNVLSLSYFLSNRSKKLGENLLVLLNILDLSASLSGTFYLVLWKFLKVHIIFEMLFLTSYLVFVECTGFVTTLLTVVRSIASHYPFYEPKRKFIAVAFTVFFIYATVKGALLVFYTNISIENEAQQIKLINIGNVMLLTSLLANITVVFITNLFVIKKLLSAGYDVASCQSSTQTNRQTNRHATVTIIILSILFCFFNLLYSAVLINFVMGKETVSPVFRNIVASTAVPLNSALNPFVYFCRKREMRVFLWRYMCCLVNSVQQRHAVHDIVFTNTATSVNIGSNSNKLACSTITEDSPPESDKPACFTIESNVGYSNDPNQLQCSTIELSGDTVELELNIS